MIYEEEIVQVPKGESQKKITQRQVEEGVQEGPWGRAAQVAQVAQWPGGPRAGGSVWAD